MLDVEVLLEYHNRVSQEICMDLDVVMSKCIIIHFDSLKIICTLVVICRVVAVHIFVLCPTNFF